MDSKVYWESIKPYILPGQHLTIIGHSKAAEKTSFYIKELGVMLDCGVPNYFIPEHIFITHGHGDHCYNLPMSIVELNNNNECVNKKVMIYVPEKIRNMARNFISSFYILSKNNPFHTKIHSKYDLIGVKNNEKINVIIKKRKWVIDIIKCDHSVPTVGYGFSEIRHKLKDEYKGLENKEIGKLKKEGFDVSDYVEMPIFCFLGDTTTKVFDNEILYKFPNIFVECTFLYDEHIKQATCTKHVHWRNLEPIIRDHPNINFILFHFSRRYTDDEIQEFFSNKIMDNMKLWIP